MASELVSQIEQTIKDNVTADMVTEKAVELVVAHTEDIKLNDEQEFIMSYIYSDILSTATIILKDNTPVAIKITVLLGMIMTTLQTMCHNNVKISGENKRAIALYLLHHLPEKLVEDPILRKELIDTVKQSGGKLLESLIDVSKGFNKAVQQVEKEVAKVVESGCCASLMGLVSSMK